MLKSRCHRAAIEVQDCSEGKSFYICSHCGLCCDVTTIRDDGDNDSRFKDEVKASIGTS